MSFISEERQVECERCGELIEITTLPGVEIKNIYCDACYDALEQEQRQENDLEAMLFIKEFRRERMDNYCSYAKDAGIPPRLHAAILDNIVVDNGNREAVEAARSFIETPRDFLLLHGDTGRGKTWLASAISRELIIRGAWVRFVAVSDMIADLAESYRRDDSFDATFKKYKNVPVLILDDLGVEKDTERSLEHVYNLIDHRYSWERGTVITSNMAGDKIAARYGTRIMSRIKTGKVVELKGKDRRL